MSEQTVPKSTADSTDKKTRIGVVCIAGGKYENAGLMASLSNSGYEVELIEARKGSDLQVLDRPTKNPMAGYGYRDEFEKRSEKVMRKKERESRMKELRLEAFNSRNH
ncbi:hypothetical protein YA0089_26810 [Pseudomonas viridiflava]|uniref:hypothetical protein n=1 Tax=Pseudomonas viridiflava TaxID=33069 RepID=UPI0018E5B0D4|nr:hypothetical protein [Pseudomonas viridiflava]MBI6727230.1 hypothetical protein [Pseudomonas viridiflava]